MNPDVVIIDDDAVVLFLHKILVKKCGYASTIEDFGNAEDALNYIRLRQKDTPLLILLDINMPLLNGWDFLEKLADIDANGPHYVIMVTSSINTADKKKAEQYPEVIDFLEKPLSTEACNRIYRDLDIS